MFLHPRSPRRLRWRTPTSILTLAILALVVLGTACSSGGAASGAGGSAGSVAPRYKVTVTGDSIALGFGASMRTAVSAEWEVKNIAESGTGLARPDRFDWPERLRQLARDFPPTVVVISLASNDAQDLTDPSGKVVVPLANASAWDAEYSKRLAAAFDAFAATSTRVIWIGHVRTTEARVATVNRHIHELAKAVAATRPFVDISDFAELLGAGNEVATRCLLKDGLHLTTECLDEAAAKLQPLLRPR